MCWLAVSLQPICRRNKISVDTLLMLLKSNLMFRLQRPTMGQFSLHFCHELTHTIAFFYPLTQGAL